MDLNFNSIISSLQQDSEQNLELEIRYGKFTGGRFNSDVNSQLFYSLVNKLEPFKTAEEISTIYCRNNIRKIVTGNEIRWESKHKIKNYDYPEYGIRISLSRERNVDVGVVDVDVDYQIVRERKRRSYVFPGYLRIDLTVVNSRNKTENKSTHEVEVEYLGNIKDEKSISIFLDQGLEVWKILYQSENIYSLREISKLKDCYSSVDDSTDGLVESTSNKRRLLTINDGKLWIYRSPIYYNLLETVLPKSLSKFNGLILDGYLSSKGRYKVKTLLVKCNSEFKLEEFISAFNLCYPNIKIINQIDG